MDAATSDPVDAATDSTVTQQVHDDGDFGKLLQLFGKLFFFFVFFFRFFFF